MVSCLLSSSSIDFELNLRSLITDFYIPNPQHSQLNPFSPPQAFVNSGPDSFINFTQYEGDYYGQSSYADQPPKTPIRTPVMGTRTYQHRRTFSNASSQYSNRGAPIDYGEVVTAEHDYRFNNFNVSGEPLQFHSVPYSYNHPDTTNTHQIPNRMQLYENVSHFQHLLEASPQSASQHQAPLKTSHIETTCISQDFSRGNSVTNSMRREMFFNPDPRPSSPKSTQCTTYGSERHQAIESTANTFNATKLTGSTGCTPTHSTPQDSFSDDSSYLSALSSQNRVRFSPDNFLTDNAAFSPTSRIAVANLQRAMIRRTMELEEGEKS